MPDQEKQAQHFLATLHYENAFFKKVRCLLAKKRVELENQPFSGIASYGLHFALFKET